MSPPHTEMGVSSHQSGGQVPSQAQFLSLRAVGVAALLRSFVERCWLVQ